MDTAWQLGRRVVDFFTLPATHLVQLLLVCGLWEERLQTGWVTLFERHPNVEVIGHDTTGAICEALHNLRFFFSRVVRGGRLELLYFTSFAGSGKSRFCGQLATFVQLVQQGDGGAADALDAWTPSTLASPMAVQGMLSSWVKQLRIVGVNFNSTTWNLNPTDRELLKHGMFVPLYLRILFFLTGDLQNSRTMVSSWALFLERSRLLLEKRYIIELTLVQKVQSVLSSLVGEGPGRRPLIIIVDELQKVSDFFSYTSIDLGDLYRSELCTLAEKVHGHTVFSSVNVQLMIKETSSSRRPVVELLRLPRVPASRIFEEVLRVNGERGVYLNYGGSLASSTFAPSPVAADAVLAESGVAALSCLVGDDVRLATFLAVDLMSQSIGSGTIWDYADGASNRTSSAVGNLWDQPYGPEVLAHVILGHEVAAERDVLDANGRSKGATWDQVRLRGHVLAVGGKAFTPRLPLLALWGLVSNNVKEQVPLFRGIRMLLSWTPLMVSWCGWEVFFLASVMVLANARALVAGAGDLCSLSDIYSSSTHVGSGSIVVDQIIDPANPRFNLCTSTIDSLWARFVDDDGSLVNRVWKLNTNAAAIDAVIFYRTGDGALAMVCIQNKFSARDASTLLGWRESSTLVAAMQQVVSNAAERATAADATARKTWSLMSPRVAFILAARRKRRDSPAASRQQQLHQHMDSAIVLCWEDMEQYVGSFLSGLVEHADTLFGAELATDADVQ